VAGKLVLEARHKVVNQFGVLNGAVQLCVIHELNEVRVRILIALRTNVKVVEMKEADQERGTPLHFDADLLKQFSTQ
jgi:hypothetical protein